MKELKNTLERSEKWRFESNDGTYFAVVKHQTWVGARAEALVVINALAAENDDGAYDSGELVCTANPIENPGDDPLAPNGPPLIVSRGARKRKAPFFVSAEQVEALVQVFEGSRRNSIAKGWQPEKGLETHTEVNSFLDHLEDELREAREAADGRWERHEGKNGKPEGLVIELADVVMLCAHLAGGLGENLALALRDKIAYNTTRPYLHGRATAAPRVKSLATSVHPRVS